MDWKSRNMGSFQFKEHVMEIPAGFKCKFCGSEYAGNIASFLWHFAKIEGHDINICPSVSEVVQKAAYASASSEEIPSSKRRCISNPAHVSGASTPMSNSPLIYSGAVGNNGLVKTVGRQLFTAEIVGNRFSMFFKDILSCLMDDNVSTFGICGVAGVGKTLLASSLNNYLLKTPNKFYLVIFVDASLDWRLKQTTLSPHCMIHKMQGVISEAIGLSLSDDADNEKRRVQLSDVLTAKKKCLVILDDVWDYFSLQEVGIPLGVNQCTVGITTRSLNVCRGFGCQRRIDIKCLPQNESYALYRNILGNDTTLSEEGEKISRSIVDKCGGLPLAVKTMARKMKGITNPNQLRSAVDGIMRKTVIAQIFNELKLSYDRLQDATLQHCFLYCLILVGEAYQTAMEFLVDEGIPKRMTSRRRKLGEADAMLKILEDACLLEIDDDNSVQMNEVIQGMALQIMEENEQRAVRIEGISVLPDLESWTEDLVRVALTDTTGIKEIPENYLPSCSKLSTLLLSENHCLGYIGDSFFVGLPGLTVLCLSGTGIESLPISLFGLVNLRTLLLDGCKRLRKIPSIAKLRALKKLDLCGSGLEEVPDDMDVLSELEYLDLGGTRVKELKSGILAKFSRLQFLVLPWSSSVTAEEIACLSRLEVLCCRFSDLVELNKYLVPLKGFKEREPPIKLHVQAGGLNIECPSYTVFQYCLLLDDYDYDLFRDMQDDYDSLFFYKDWSVLGLHQCNVNEPVDVLNNFQMIVIVKCNESRSFCDFSPIKNAAEFQNFSVRECDGIEFLFSLSLPAKGILEKLENIGLIKLRNFSRLFSKAGDLSVRPPYGTCFSHLRRFIIRDCPSIKQLFPLDLLPNLKNLEVIDVRNCAQLVEIFATEEHEEGNSMVQQINHFSLPKLRWFRLRDLPELERIGNVRIICDALDNIYFEGCPNLKIADVQVYRSTPPEGSLIQVPFRRYKKVPRFFPAEHRVRLICAQPDTDSGEHVAGPVSMLPPH